MAQERLQKILAGAGVASRRAAEKYITDGRVKVNGQIVRELGAKADAASDTIVVEGYGVLTTEELVYIVLHKPENVVTTVKDPEGRQTILDVIEMTRAVGKRRFEGALPRIFPVGRLDFDAEGLLLLTNDGELSQRLLHPRQHVPKTYAVKLKGRPEPKQIERLRRGVRLKERSGRLSYRPTAPADVEVLRNSKVNTWLELTIIEGRHHQVKRMCQAIGHSALRLVRTAFAGIQLGDLPNGAWRFLTPQELTMLQRWGTEPGAGKKTRRPATAAGKAAKEARDRKAGAKSAKKPAGRRADGSSTKKAEGRSSGSSSKKSTTRKTSGATAKRPAGRKTTGKPAAGGNKTSRGSARSPRRR